MDPIDCGICVLRPWRASDAPIITPLLGDRDVCNNLRDRVSSMIRPIVGIPIEVAVGFENSSRRHFLDNVIRQFLEQWQQADQGLPELREAQDYLKKVP